MRVKSGVAVHIAQKILGAARLIFAFAVMVPEVPLERVVQRIFGNVNIFIALHVGD